MRGKLIVIEGTDGSGKATQSGKMAARLAAEGFTVRKVDYPNYQSQSSALVKMYLNGEFGERPEDVNAYAASAFYAVDRIASYKKEWEEFYLNGGIVIADRYTTSNMIHQAAKIKDKAEKERYLEWLGDFEFTKCGLPVPDKVFFLAMPPAVSRELMRGRENKAGNVKDIHEQDSDYLSYCFANACDIAATFGWHRVDCTDSGQIKTIEQIHEEIYQELHRMIGRA
ncbi:dTMP kinase [Sporomusa sphaeroides]|uniref:Thymidylate kinase n=1 Tax=Sporomusa sphaeroides DSM 2875 TaxID=1337886 RepID=A0ABM9W1H2_9FIRM|nr:thymidylate kinase [Sporomusa sphaeroides]OLS56646.1 thymidylate kinase [Sporomusa sphaeroides DSM 2875]CVK18986.1 Thymidylate kinase [Sporomusa sphaeroides DSM 2875]